MCKYPEVAWLKERYSYNAETGDVVRIQDGKIAKSESYGYIRVRLTFDGRQLDVPAHRMAWALCFGKWPEHQVDHINGNRSDNRLCNLREATHKQNQWNRAGHADRRKSPYAGVHSLPNGKWRGMIMVSGKRHHLGVFDNPNDAFAAYQNASREMRGEFSRI